MSKRSTLDFEQRKKYALRLEQAIKSISTADTLVLGGGAGLSDAAGLKYSGSRFADNFEPFIKRYGMEDMYTSSFYRFKTEEERWAYWARHIIVNRYDPPAAQLYQDLLALSLGKKFFVITTNVDHQFHKAGFPDEKIFAVQGDYGYFQCAKGCHQKLYENENLVREMVEQTSDCKIPTSLVPHCPVCGGPMDVNIRKDEYFVEDEAWDKAREGYTAFIEEAAASRTVFLELGVGFNTPGIIRFPFEQMTYQNDNAVLIRMNTDHPYGVKENMEKTISFNEDMTETVGALLEKCHA